MSEGKIRNTLVGYCPAAHQGPCRELLKHLIAVLEKRQSIFFSLASQLFLSAAEASVEVTSSLAPPPPPSSQSANMTPHHLNAALGSLGVMDEGRTEETREHKSGAWESEACFVPVIHLSQLKKKKKNFKKIDH